MVAVTDAVIEEESKGGGRRGREGVEMTMKRTWVTSSVDDSGGYDDNGDNKKDRWKTREDDGGGGD